MPICCHGRFLRFPSSLPPPFLLPSSSVLLPFSRFTRARVTPEAQWINWTKGTTRERRGGEEKREREREEDGDCIWGGRVANNVANRPEKECYCEDRPRRFFLSLSLLFLFFFHPVPRLLFFPRLSFLSPFSAFIFSCRTISSSRIRSEKCDKHEEDKNELSSILHGSTMKH